MKFLLTLFFCTPLALAEETTRSSVESRRQPGLILNQMMSEGWNSPSDKIDLNEADDVFWHVFSRLPGEVMVYPGENYYYWKLIVDGREIWGNIRLPTGRRDKGVVSFGYSEFEEFPSTGGGGRRLSKAKYFTKGDGVEVVKKDNFTYVVSGDGKSVIFHLNQISQHAPKSFKIPADEQFLQRTYDESGLQFFLMFNHKLNYFLWVLDEEGHVPEQFTSIGDEVLVGNRTGFVFWQDPKVKSRKILATIRKLSVMRNDYYDGPFDQLSDNFVDTGEVEILKYIELAIPTIKGRIDKYGYYTDTEQPSRVALSNYGNYYTFAEAIEFVSKAKQSFDPYYYISRGGYPPQGKNWDGSELKPTSNPVAVPTAETPVLPSVPVVAPSLEPKK